MTKDVLVRVTGTQQMADDPQSAEEKIELLLPGTWYEKNGREYLLYEEYMDELPVKNRIKYDDMSLEIVKNGEVRTRMIFIPGATSAGEYHTPYGTMTLKIHTSCVTVERAEQIRIRLEYRLDMEQAPLSFHTLELEIRSRHGTSAGAGE